MATAHPPQAESPCIQTCTLDEDGVCLGCFRTRNEIMLWTRLTLEGQQDVLRRCQRRARKSASKQA